MCHCRKCLYSHTFASDPLLLYCIAGCQGMILNLGFIYRKGADYQSPLLFYMSCLVEIKDSFIPLSKIHRLLLSFA